ncbi:MAG: AAA family ATPase, partial [Candidatus Binatia bacterium]
MSLGPESILPGDYRVLGQLRQGGMGVVYRALHQGLGVERAVKVIRADQSDDPIAAEFFLREAHALLDVQHEAVVRCHELLRDEQERFYLVMDLIDGPSLADLVKERTFTGGEAHALLQRVGQGLAAAHACGVVHRDISPENVLVPHGRPELAKLIDFGLAKLVATGEQTIQEGFKGRLAYASPEQFGLFGGRVDHRSDIYSLGVVLAEAAGGGRMFARQNFLEAFESRRSVPTLSQSIVPGLRSLIEWMLAPQPKDRPESVSALLGAAVALDEIEQRTPSPGPAERRRTVVQVPPPAPMVERRQVTAMYCDLAEASTLGASLDVEDFHDVLQEYHEAVASVLERYDAEIARHASNAIVVYFGYPRAHEDDARRAVLAGLDLLSMLGERRFGGRSGLDLRLSARIGIHTGPVVVGGTGTYDSGTRPVLGHTVELAAALVAESRPGTVSVSSTTLPLTRGAFTTIDCGLVHFGQGGAAVHGYTIVPEPATSSPAAAFSGPEATPLVGREADLRGLDDAWKGVLAGRGHAVFLSGEAGVGKSRLVRAFRERLAIREHAWLDCACSALATNSPLFPVLGLLGQLIRLDRRRGDVAKRRDLLAELERPAVASDDWLPLFKRILALVSEDEAREESPERLRRRTLVALADWVRDFATQQPTVLVLEDLHWSDPSTREFFSLLLRRLDGVPLLCLVTHRPEFVDPWADSEYVTTHILERLGAEEAEALVEKMRESVALSAAARREIAA